MGIAKRMAMSAERKRQIALEIAIEAGAIAVCQLHETPIDIGGDRQAARTLANRLLTRRDPRVAEFRRQERQEFLALVDQIVAEQGDTCVLCAAIE